MIEAMELYASSDILHRGSLAGKPKPGCVTCVGCGIAKRRAPTKVRGAKA